MAAVLDILIFLCTLVCVITCFRREGQWDAQQGRKALRFFTLLSNIFSMRCVTKKPPNMLIEAIAMATAAIAMTRM